ncbi:hypothetical protein [Streptomyces sp. NRRL S-237]|uniref:hypothetical protein n=1 Tax=Streptomyces sp. NRRL S-237 TaxID=1463895 RepID=UPI000B16994C|nr:hypothetical protein [Streptomyces sp. NRRL S-237]
MCAEPVGGPLDGLLLDITGWRADEIRTGVALMTELGQFGPGARALYDRAPATHADGTVQATRAAPQRRW